MRRRIPSPDDRHRPAPSRWALRRGTSTAPRRRCPRFNTHSGCPASAANASGFVLTPLSKVTRRSTSWSTSYAVRRVTPDRVLSSLRTYIGGPDFHLLEPTEELAALPRRAPARSVGLLTLDAGVRVAHTMHPRSRALVLTGMDVEPAKRKRATSPQAPWSVPLPSSGRR